MLSSRRLASGRAAARFGIWRGPEVMIFDQKSPKYVSGNFEKSRFCRQIWIEIKSTPRDADKREGDISQKVVKKMPRTNVSSINNGSQSSGMDSGSKNLDFFGPKSRVSSVCRVFQAQEHSQNDPDQFWENDFRRISSSFVGIFGGSPDFSCKV